MSPTLYYSPGSCSLAPHIVLEEIGLPYALSLASTSDGTTQSPAHLRLNPKGRVPVLVTGASVLTEAPAILLHLAISNPTTNLLPNTADGLVRSIEWFNWLSGTVHAVAIRQIWRPASFSRDPSHHNDIIAVGKTNLEAAFALIEARMSGCTWAVGTCYTTVDPYLLVVFRWGNRVGFNMRKQYTAWTQHALRVLERPAVERALEQEGISVWE
ncbi:MAG: glutathione S-transferase N-terminal domain-containing protein [Hydrogenophaga sp.]|nr:glutathione S-transferase N-terminal domain-containing protein [Hydrogenophaga sp.]